MESGKFGENISKILACVIEELSYLCALEEVASPLDVHFQVKIEVQESGWRRSCVEDNLRPNLLKSSMDCFLVRYIYIVILDGRRLNTVLSCP